MLSTFFDTYVTEYQPYKRGAVCYEDGCIYRGLELLHRATGESRWSAHLHRLLDAQVKSGPVLAGYDPSEYNIDNVQSGRGLLYLHELTGEERYLEAAGLMIRQLETHPRTKSGVYWHKLRYPWQVWLDGLYMAAPFQISHAKLTNRPEAIEDSLTQIATALEHTREPSARLYKHAFDEARMQKWADPVTGRSRAFWARALGWLAMSLVDVAELVGPERFEPLRPATIELLEALQALRQPDGLWLQVIDQPDLPGNYQESSASAMFIYAITQATRLGLIAPSPVNLLDVLISSKVRKGPEGRTEMFDICEVAGLGGMEGVYRDGSPEYYLTEPRVANDAKGVAPLMACVAVTAMASGVPRDSLVHG